MLEVINSFGNVTGARIPYDFAPRRDGDVAEIYANAMRALELLGWKPRQSLEDMCRDHWLWQSRNPDGYAHRDKMSEAKHAR